MRRDEVARNNSMFARDQTGDVLPVIKCNALLAGEQAGEFYSRAGDVSS